MAKMSQEELLEQVKKLRTERSEEVEMAKDARQSETTFQKWKRYVTGGLAFSLYKNRHILFINIFCCFKIG